jgi:hypothetical protein
MAAVKTAMIKIGNAHSFPGVRTQFLLLSTNQEMSGRYQFLS